MGLVRVNATASGGSLILVDAHILKFFDSTLTGFFRVVRVVGSSLETADD